MPECQIVCLRPSWWCQHLKCLVAYLLTSSAWQHVHKCTCAHMLQQMFICTQGTIARMLSRNPAGSIKCSWYNMIELCAHPGSSELAADVIRWHHLSRSRRLNSQGPPAAPKVLVTLVLVCSACTKLTMRCSSGCCRFGYKDSEQQYILVLS